MTTFRLMLAAAALVATACDSAPFDPNFIEDVQPEILANCVRCHSRPARGGAPDTFRLDVYRNTQLADGRVIYGAQTMAEYVEIRAGVEGTMPPNYARSDRTRDTFMNWFTAAGTAPNRGTRAGNRKPTATLLNELAAVDKDMVTIEYEIGDVDHDTVHGRLKVGDRIVADDLHTGRGTTTFFAGDYAEGDHPIIAELSDGSGDGEELFGPVAFITVYPTQASLGSLQVRHADGNTAPKVDIVRLVNEEPADPATIPNPNLREGYFGVNDVLIAAAQGPAKMRVKIADPDGGLHQVTIVAFRGSEEIAVATLTDVDTERDFDWNVTNIADGPGWRLRATATDDQGATGTDDTGNLIISHSTTTETFDSISPLIADNCGTCHTHPNEGGRVPNLAFLLNAQDPSSCMDPVDRDACLKYEKVYHEVNRKAGWIYERAILIGNMPPKSAASSQFFGDRVNAGMLSDADRARLADYLLGGSPR